VDGKLLRGNIRSKGGILPNLTLLGFLLKAGKGGQISLGGW